MNFPKNCPHCKENVDGGDIYDFFLDKYHDEEKAKEAASYYGWTEENRVRFSKLVGMYSLEEDRTTHFVCPECEKKVDLCKR